MFTQGRFGSKVKLKKENKDAKIHLLVPASRRWCGRDVVRVDKRGLKRIPNYGSEAITGNGEAAHKAMVTGEPL